MIVAGTLARAGRLADGWVEIIGTEIADAGDGAPPRPADEHCDGVLAPGLCDLQVNGAAGHQVSDGGAALDAIDAVQLEHGVTSYLPTLISPDDATAERVLPELLARSADPASPVAGVHVEGPFLNPEQAGVHPRSRLRSPADGVPPWLERARLVTLAPELPAALELVRRLVSRGVTVALGHSAADRDTALAAVDAGVTLATHVFNALPFGHRDRCAAAVALVDPRVRPTLIADGEHVDPLVLELARRAAPDRAILVSDSSPAAASPAGTYRLAGVEIAARAGAAPRTAAGTLAASALTLDAAVRNWHAMTGATLAEALRAAGELPSASIGLPSGIVAGAPANLIAVDATGRVTRVMWRGRWVG